ncbi:DUF1643 domain-containing protein [Microbacterium sp. OR16]|uniref:DUF1643 domain-containing protein n=1 Tax=Microbacterium sp. OR16 TaxID=3095345 RepID=UPI0039B56170
MAQRYTRGSEPTFTRPKIENNEYRFAIGRVDKRCADPLVVLGMNPSHATMKRSDRTVNRVIRASEELGHDGWVMLNLYPERNPDQQSLGKYSKKLSKKNARAIVKRVRKLGVKRILGAWGDLKHPALKRARSDVLKRLKKAGIEVYYFGSLTKNGNPRHPNPRSGEWKTVAPRKRLKI